jgi:hypothetical protein
VGQQGVPADPSSGTPAIPGSIMEWHNGTTKTAATFGPGSGPSDVAAILPGIDGYTIGAGESGPSSDANHVGVTFGGSGHDLLDLGANEANKNPDQHQSYGPVSIDPACLRQVPEGLKGQLQRYTGIVDSNVYSLDVSLGGVLVTDAAANAVYRIGPHGIQRTWVLPPVHETITADVLAGLNAQAPPDQQAPDCLIGTQWDSEPVPTSVVTGPDGAYYVTSLAGGPAEAGSGGIFRIDPRTNSITRWASGFDGAVDLAFGPGGSVYVAELFGGSGGGAITKVATHWTAHGLVAGAHSTVADDSNGVVQPIRVAVAPNGTIYASIDVFGPGKVVKITR